MAVIGDRTNVAVDIRIEVPAALAMVDAARNHVPEMGNHAGADKELAFSVVIDSPRITESMRHDLETLFRRVIAPNTTVDIYRLVGEFDVVRERFLVFVESSLAGRFADL